MVFSAFNGLRWYRCISGKRQRTSENVYFNKRVQCFGLEVFNILKLLHVFVISKKT